MAKSIVRLSESLKSYSSYLWDKQLSINDRRVQNCAKFNGIDLYFVEPSSKENRYDREYVELDEKLQALDNYQPLNLCGYAPFDRRAKYRWFQNIKVSCRIQVYRLKNRQITYAWRLPEEISQVKNLDTIQIVNKMVDEAHLLPLKEAAMKKFENQYLWSRGDLLDIIEVASMNLTDEEAGDFRSDEHVDAIKSYFESGESVADTIETYHEIIQETKRVSKFEKFFAALQEILDANAVPDERRADTTYCVSPLCVSLRDLMEKAVSKMYEMFPNENVDKLMIPTYEWTRRQFTPCNPRSRIANSYKGRYKIKWTMQTRLLRKHHDDQYYAAKIFSFFKEIAERYTQ